jgi:hypothetical protein
VKSIQNRAAGLPRPPTKMHSQSSPTHLEGSRGRQFLNQMVLPKPACKKASFLYSNRPLQGASLSNNVTLLWQGGPEKTSLAPAMPQASPTSTNAGPTTEVCLTLLPFESFREA